MSNRSGVSRGDRNRNARKNAPNQLWVGDITEHGTGAGKLYVCAFKDVYSIDSAMTSKIAVTALANAVARSGVPLRGQVTWVLACRDGQRLLVAVDAPSRTGPFPFTVRRPSRSRRLRTQPR